MCHCVRPVGKHHDSSPLSACGHGAEELRYATLRAIFTSVFHSQTGCSPQWLKQDSVISGLLLVILYSLEITFIHSEMLWIIFDRISEKYGFVSISWKKNL